MNFSWLHKNKPKVFIVEVTCLVYGSPSFSSASHLSFISPRYIFVQNHAIKRLIEPSQCDECMALPIKGWFPFWPLESSCLGRHLGNANAILEQQNIFTMTFNFPHKLCLLIFPLIVTLPLCCSQRRLCNRRNALTTYAVGEGFWSAQPSSTWHA